MASSSTLLRMPQPLLSLRREVRVVLALPSLKRSPRKRLRHPLSSLNLHKPLLQARKRLPDITFLLESTSSRAHTSRMGKMCR
jgi:5-enolpyruvylshikimate-3-phosphate synthase